MIILVEIIFVLITFAVIHYFYVRYKYLKISNQFPGPRNIPFIGCLADLPSDPKGELLFLS